MKLSCLQENLNRGLSIVGRAVATRTTLPITNNVLLATDDGRLKLVATNLEMAISCWIGAKIEEEGAITVPARLLTEFVSSLPNDTIDVHLSPQTKTLGLKCARFEARISGVDAKEFPPIPSVDEGIKTKVEVEALHQGINLVVCQQAAHSRSGQRVDPGYHSGEDAGRAEPPRGRTGGSHRHNAQSQQEPDTVPPEEHGTGLAVSPGHLPELRPANSAELQYAGNSERGRVPEGDQNCLNLRPRRQRHRATGNNAGD